MANVASTRTPADHTLCGADEAQTEPAKDVVF
eukprot:CAMPEP_0174369930 /NCGR_PEP_ID=MMETSP0811_2-20130205/94308_1 /TAXON_ID=73025 ORGANISM="Eutreptiella gymnastica-like, Strain CCMP1594" /NCGR_SAMPLE_ID=MMETSP0811_2 /ASSEMBLY_ACC=CAM_ASM_000667 /LENGTH=31 /DNA_ID= /DNA_START= /DNA_END= /DNA_ORIENTATION=